MKNSNTEDYFSIPFFFFNQNQAELYVKINIESKIIVTSGGRFEVGVRKEYTKPTQGTMLKYKCFLVVLPFLKDAFFFPPNSPFHLECSVSGGGLNPDLHLMESHWFIHSPARVVVFGTPFLLRLARWKTLAQPQLQLTSLVLSSIWFITWLFSLLSFELRYAS